MIAHLSGKILKITEKGIILTVNQIGYFINLTKDTISNLNENKEINIFEIMYYLEWSKMDEFEYYEF